MNALEHDYLSTLRGRIVTSVAATTDCVRTENLNWLDESRALSTNSFQFRNGSLKVSLMAVWSSSLFAPPTTDSTSSSWP